MDDHESDYALNEAIQTLHTPRQLCLLFVHLLVNDCIPTPLQTWNRFHMHFATDYIIKNHLNIDLALNFALQDISTYLDKHGKMLGDFGLPQLTTCGQEIVHEL